MRKKEKKSDSILSKLNLYNPFASLIEAVVTGIILVVFVICIALFVKLF